MSLLAPADFLSMSCWLMVALTASRSVKSSHTPSSPSHGKVALSINPVALPVPFPPSYYSMTESETSTEEMKPLNITTGTTSMMVLCQVSSLRERLVTSGSMRHTYSRERSFGSEHKVRLVIRHTEGFGQGPSQDVTIQLRPSLEPMTL